MMKLIHESVFIEGLYVLISQAQESDRFLLKIGAFQ